MDANSSMRNLNDNEKQTMKKMKALHIAEKRLLWELIKQTNKDGIAIYNGSINDLQFLINKNLIVINTWYTGKGNSIIVLPTSQTLIRKLQN